MRLLLIILLFVALYYMVSRYLFPYLLQRFVKKAQQRFNESQNQKRPEGDVSVDYVPPKAGKTQYNPDSIEDVDYEEVKEK